MRRAFTMGFLGSAAMAASAQPCAPWQVVETPSPPGSSQSVIRDIVAISADDVWAVGSYVDATRIAQMAMHWDGSQWSFFSVPVFVPGGSGYLWSVDAAGPDDVWAAGDAIRVAPDGFVGTHMLVVHWDGAKWTRMNTPINTGSSGDLIWDTKVVGPNEVWFVGEGFPVPASPQPPLAMRWRNGAFELLSPPVLNPQVSGFGNGNSFHAVDALSPSDLWVVGAAGDGDSISNVSQILHFDGANWEHRPGPTPGVYHDLNAVVMVEHDDVWAGGDYFDGERYRGLALHWNGTGWTQVPVPGTVNDFVAFGPDDIYAVGGGVMHWDGEQWTTVESFPGVDSPALTGISALGPCDMWTGGRQFVGDTIVNFAARVNAGDECRADFDASGFVDTDDYDAFVTAFEQGLPTADFDASGFVDTDDFDAFVVAFEAGC